jgi:hypothetical protein
MNIALHCPLRWWFIDVIGYKYCGALHHLTLVVR